MNKNHELDFERKNRIGIAESIFCQNKSLSQIIDILKDLNKKETTLFTRLEENKYKKLPIKIKKIFKYNKESKTAIYGKPPEFNNTKKIALISAGTSDVSCLMEAKYTLLCSGYNTETFVDVGVSGLWRLQKHIKKIRTFDIVIVAAGMDGALVSVIGGLIPNPIIAIPTSTGYGVSNKGETALNAMLASCAPGISVVNIDNGYGAACAAIRILNNGR